MKKIQMTVDEFKAKCIAQNPLARFDEHGKHGWTDLADICNHVIDGGPNPTSKQGPHWINAGAPKSQWLIGTYDCNTGTAMFFDTK